MGQTILIVEDESAIAQKVRLYFERAGYQVLLAEDGLAGLEMARRKQPDLIILDLMLPKMDGLVVCETLRNEGNETPIIMLTALSGEADRIEGLESGADDYVSKPFFAKELVARAKAVLRRGQKSIKSAETSKQLLTIGEIQLNLNAHECYVGGESVKLSRTQIGILETLMRHVGVVLTRDQLLDAAFQESFEGMDVEEIKYLVKNHMKVKPSTWDQMKDKKKRH